MVHVCVQLQKFNHHVNSIFKRTIGAEFEFFLIPNMCEQRINHWLISFFGHPLNSKYLILKERQFNNFMNSFRNVAATKANQTQASGNQMHFKPKLDHIILDNSIKYCRV